MSRRFHIALVFLTAFVCQTQACDSNRIVMPRLFGHNMVLQRDTAVAIWGKAPAGTNITISISNVIAQTQTNTRGLWFTHIPALTAGGPYTMQVTGLDTLTFNNVLVGDVWLASGQSNMTWKVGWGIDNKDEVIKTSENTNIRFFTVADDLHNKPQSDVSGGQWLSSNSDNIIDFSATAYFLPKKCSKNWAFLLALFIPRGEAQKLSRG